MDGRSFARLTDEVLVEVGGSGWNRSWNRGRSFEQKFAKETKNTGMIHYLVVIVN